MLHFYNLQFPSAFSKILNLNFEQGYCFRYTAKIKQYYGTEFYRSSRFLKYIIIECINNMIFRSKLCKSKCQETLCKNLIFAGHFDVHFRHNTGNELSKYFVSIQSRIYHQGIFNY